MKRIVIDTEGTGLFTHRNPDGTVRPSDAPGQPRMCEFAAVLLDEAWNVERTFQAYIRPENWLNENGDPLTEVPAKALEVHGLNMAFLTANGIPAAEALAPYIAAIEEGRVLVGFNQQHDGRQVRAELRHAGLDDMFERTLNVCAMRSISTNYKGQVKKLNGKGGFPRLIDAAAHFGIPYPEDRRHTALEDALVTAEVAKRLDAMGLLLEPAVHYASGHSKEGDVA